MKYKSSVINNSQDNEQKPLFYKVKIFLMEMHAAIYFTLNYNPGHWVRYIKFVSELIFEDLWVSVHCNTGENMFTY